VKITERETTVADIPIISGEANLDRISQKKYPKIITEIPSKNK